MTFRRTGTWAWVAAAILSAAAAAHAEPGFGKIAGVVVDPSGTPQLGATVQVMQEGLLGRTPGEVLTNQLGNFTAERLLPGQYSLKVTLAGFLPGLERHVKVGSNLTTMVRIELGSMFASLDRLRKRSDVPADPDEWKWVLRTSAATRPVLQWQDGEVQVADAAAGGGSEANRRHQPHARLELTSGSLQRGSASHLPDSPGTAFAYDQSIGRTGRLLLAGQMSYEGTASGGLATLWVPSGEIGVGPMTSIVLRQSKLGPGLTFRGVRLAHSDQLALNDRLRVQYGIEYVMVGLGRAASSLRPRLEFDARLSPDWQVYAKVAGMPVAPEMMQPEMLQTALAAMDAFPALMRLNRRPVLEGGWHDEMGFERRVGKNSYFDVAGFRDRLNNIALYGRGRGIAHCPDFFRDTFSDAAVYDGGSSNSWGTRVAYRQKISEDLEVTAVYAWGGAMAESDAPSLDKPLRENLQTRYVHSVAARVSGHVPALGTRVVASYKWLSGSVLSHQDVYGESALQLDPYFNLSVRQPLPVWFMSGKWEALADFRNLLAEGYVSVASSDGRITLVPAVRSFRGGFSFQF